MQRGMRRSQSVQKSLMLREGPLLCANISLNRLEAQLVVGFFVIPACKGTIRQWTSGPFTAEGNLDALAASHATHTASCTG